MMNSEHLLMFFAFSRSLVHVDADARMNAYEGEDGKKQYNLSLYQRKLFASYL
jgi:hypothetical protein